jgi:mono/diheme cytochrome c family protein
MRAISLIFLAAGISACMPEPEGVSRIAPAESGFERLAEGDEVSHGRRLSKILGCNACHGADYQGGSYADDPDGGFVYSSNLTRAVPRLSDKQLRLLLTEGIHPHRSNLWYMPAKNLQRLAAGDLDALVTFLRTLEHAGREWPIPADGEGTETLLELGILETSPILVQAYRHQLPLDLGPALSQGRYIAGVSCAECHGADLRGSMSAPSLDAVKAYDRQAFARLLLEGETTGGREHGMMSLLAKRNLKHLTKGEVAALHDYLTARSAAAD